MRKNMYLGLKSNKRMIASILSPKSNKSMIASILTPKSNKSMIASSLTPKSNKSMIAGFLTPKESNVYRKLFPHPQYDSIGVECDFDHCDFYKHTIPSGLAFRKCQKYFICRSLLTLTVFLLALHIHTQAIAQDIHTPPPRYLLTQKKITFAIQPFQLFNNCLRSDIEIRLGNGPGWLQFGSTIYYADYEKDKPDHFYGGENYVYKRYSMFRESYSKLKGGGLDINYKRFINPNRSFYTATGLSYTYFDINYYGAYGKWNDYTEDGLPYHEYVYTVGYHSQHINRVSINQYWGFQVPTRSAFLFDFFWGLSYRYCFIDKDKPSFNRSPFSYGYSGPTFMTGIRLGFKL